MSVITQIWLLLSVERLKNISSVGGIDSKFYQGLIQISSVKYLLKRSFKIKTFRYMTPCNLVAT